MGAKKGGHRDEAEEDLARDPLQAILLADSFAQKFRPITLERPKVLLPIVNVPMIDYTLAWLESAGVEEVFVFCCAHVRQVTDYLETTKWLTQPNFKVSTIESHNCVSAGDALRVIYEKNVIRGDFILISGDTVSNMSLTEVLQEHKERRRKDSNAVMTMVIKKSKPSAITHQSRLGTDELIMAIDPDTKQLLYYEDKVEHLKGITLDKAMLSENASVSLYNDKQDCYIDICSPEVLILFNDNFDYQHIRRHFLKGLLQDDIMGYKIFTYEIRSSYAARIDNYRSYDAISKDIIQRWTYPLVPDVQFFKNSATKLERQGMYRASEVGQSRSAQIGPSTVIGNGTTIGNKTAISNSVVGEGCCIGSNVTIEGCYIWHNVTIEDGCKLKHAIICDGVILKAGAVLEPGVVLSFKVVIGEQFVVPAYSKVSLLRQPINQDSDEELEYADDSSGVAEHSPIANGAIRNDSSEMDACTTSEVGTNGVGFIWSLNEAALEEEWRHSVAPIPADKLAAIMLAANGDPDLLTHDENILPPSGELEPESVTNDSDTDVNDEATYFEKEVEATFLRAVEEDVKNDHIILEVNSLRLSYNMTALDCASALFYSVMKLALDMQHNTASELFTNVAKVLAKWKTLLKSYLLTIDEEIEVIMKFEDICMGSAREYAVLFEQILHLLYDKEIIQEEAILSWASEKEEAEESDKVFVKKCEKFIRWLNEASEEEEEDEDE
ncbi:hypothetical protein DCAR_0207235 [Daucus carota subsp. sativus]|uniref:Translation initiation factor eIF2B subunit epsilon n=1 Tax=Daucus carota subsp. sativus TaxID=79200 RepID=A0AAF0WED6_DAUCS|nr:PREDICTED: translation initiation factor eIF-2B subunit epsilon [Daucus carota subsp. sativus]WOG88002.1 hypothetical protein DCAR_0207235 [Daucus carota subsp. sativus]